VSNLLAVALVGLLIQIVVIGLVHSGQLRAAMSVFFSFLLVLSVAALIIYGVESNSLLMLTLPLLYIGLVWSWREISSVLTVDIFLVVGVGLLESRGLLGTLGAPLTAAQTPSRIVIAVALLTACGVLAGIFSNELQRVLRYSGRLITQLRATAEIAQIAATVGGPDELMQRTVSYIRDRFGFYHVQIFLIDAERRYANLVASTGEVGEMLMQRGYRLAVGSQSAIGRALQTAEPSIITSRETELDGLSQRTTELLRETRSELVLPLIVGEQVIGVLDVQSARPSAFALEIVDSLTILATQVGVAVFHSRQLEEHKVALSDTRRLFLEAEVNLREAQRLNQRLTGQAWEDYLKSRSSQIVGYTLADNRLQRDSTWTPELQQAAGSRRAVLSSPKPDRQIIAVPIELRGRAIGAIEVEMEGAIRQTETLEVLQSVAQRLALSIDNARLFEQAQDIAQRELEVNTISTNLQSLNDIDDLARATIQELSRALGAAQASIRLGALPIAQPANRENGNEHDRQ
jgi:GAF domain-containing protein